MDNQTIILSVVIAILLASILGCVFYIQRLQAKYAAGHTDSPQPQGNSQGRQLQLAACERLTLFAERSKLNNLISRLFNNQYSAREMQQAITGAIREEYDHNISQQLYVEPKIWEAVTKLKEQNIYIVNQIGSTLPSNATALDLNKHILDFVMQNPKSTMNNLVLEALQYEARQLIA